MGSGAGLPNSRCGISVQDHMMLLDNARQLGMVSSLQDDGRSIVSMNQRQKNAKMYTTRINTACIFKCKSILNAPAPFYANKGAGVLCAWQRNRLTSESLQHTAGGGSA